MKKLTIRLIKSLSFAIANSIIIVALLTGCEEMVTDVDAPKVDPKLVVTCYISPYTEYITANVQLSSALFTPRPGYSDSSRIINNATVWLSNGNEKVHLVYNTTDHCYKIAQSEFPIVFGESYYLTVEAPGNLKATATCTVPNYAAPDLEITSIDTINKDFDPSYILNLRFKDIQGSVNFYRVAIGQYTTLPDFYEGDQFFEVGFEHGQPYISDKNMDGEFFSFKSYEIYINDFSESKVYLAICLTDEHYYKYHEGIYNNDEENPFSEPYPIYSNIEGGLGVFAAFVQKTAVLDLE